MVGVRFVPESHGLSRPSQCFGWKSPFSTSSWPSLARRPTHNERLGAETFVHTLIAPSQSDHADHAVSHAYPYPRLQSRPRHTMPWIMPLTKANSSATVVSAAIAAARPAENATAAPPSITAEQSMLRAPEVDDSAEEHTGFSRLASEMTWPPKFLTYPSFASREKGGTSGMGVNSVTPGAPTVQVSSAVSSSALMTWSRMTPASGGGLAWTRPRRENGCAASNLK